MPTSTTSKQYNVDFKKVKAEACAEVVLAYFGLLDDLERRGDELVGACMLGDGPHGKDSSFSFNTTKGSFQCFSCKKRGSILDFVAKYTAKIEGGGCTLPIAADIVQNITDGATGGKYRDGSAPQWTEDAIAEGIEWARGQHRQRTGSVSESATPKPNEHRSDSVTPEVTDGASDDTGAVSELAECVMSWKHAEQRVKSGDIAPHRLVVVDLSSFALLQKVLL